MLLNRSKLIAKSDRPPIFYGWYMVGITWVMTFLQSAVAMSIFFKPILEEFNLDRATLSSVQTLAMLLFAGLSPLMGRLIDRFGPKAILFVCAVTQALSGAVTGTSIGRTRTGHRRVSQRRTRQS